MKHAGIDRIPAKFVKEAAVALAYSLPKIINLLIKLTVFPLECKISRLKQLSKAQKPISKPTDLFRFSLWCANLWRNQCILSYKLSLKK